MGDEPSGITRRRALALCGGAVVVSAAALLARPDRSEQNPTYGVTRYQYGDDPSQFGDLYLPTGPRRPGMMVLIHGGFWRAAYGLELNAPIAGDLAQRGWTVWNLEYRRLGNGGGWPQTFEDVAAGADHLEQMAARGIDVDLDHVVAIGHSAGGQLAAWLAGRRALSGHLPGVDPAVEISAVVSQAGVLDLSLAVHRGLGGGAVPELVGGTLRERPARYDAVDPTRQV
ncbi:MAG: alpha/beta hydrolase, partial [Nocardioidaceae bacterium]